VKLYVEGLSAFARELGSGTILRLVFYRWTRVRTVEIEIGFRPELNHLIWTHISDTLVLL